MLTSKHSNVLLKPNYCLSTQKLFFRRRLIKNRTQDDHCHYNKATGEALHLHRLGVCFLKQRSCSRTPAHTDSVSWSTWIGFLSGKTKLANRPQPLTAAPVPQFLPFSVLRLTPTARNYSINPSSPLLPLNHAGSAAHILCLGLGLFFFFFIVIVKKYNWNLSCFL